jgi:hypothetical protein
VLCLVCVVLGVCCAAADNTVQLPSLTMMRVVFIVAIVLACASGAFAAVSSHEEMVAYVNGGDFGWKAKSHPRFAAQVRVCP